MLRRAAADAQADCSIADLFCSGNPGLEVDWPSKSLSEARPRIGCLEALSSEPIVTYLVVWANLFGLRC